MKTFRMDFSKGINAKTDSRLLGDGYLLVCDNADVRSGALKPVRCPEVLRDAPDGSVSLFEYRGRYLFSSLQRYYVAEFAGLQERVYFSEGSGRPQKVIDGTQANLGTFAPIVAPAIKIGGDSTPTGIAAVVTGSGGALQKGGYGYRIGYKLTNGSVQPASTVVGNVSEDNSIVTISWTNVAIQNSDGTDARESIVVYGRSPGQERFMLDLPISATSFVDNGSLSPSGATASGFDTKAQFKYVYTLVRDVNGHRDESGPSPISAMAETASVRTITRTPGDEIVQSQIKSWNVYRTGDTDGWALVAQLPIATTSFVDNVPVTALGPGPESFYTDDDGQSVVFEEWPLGARCPVLHNEMLFMIVGNSVRWTPFGKPDAAPANYSETFPFAPMRIWSYGGCVVVLCPDRLYRLDGFSPGSIRRVDTLAVDGCIAPDSVQETSKGLAYLSTRGIMLFDGGMNASPLTEGRLEAKHLTSPAVPKIDWKWWWLPTKWGHAYASLTASRGPKDINGVVPTINDTRIIDGVMGKIRSFYFDNKYFIYSLDNVNSTYCVDFGAEGTPILTFGIKPIDVHVNSLGRCYMLLPKDDHYLDFRSIQATIDQIPSEIPEPSGDVAVYQFGKGGEAIPFYFYTGPMAQGSPVERKKYRYLEFHGKGTMDIRVYVDGRIIGTKSVTASEVPTHDRKMKLPRGTKGYAIELEGSGDGDLLAVELAYHMMESTS